MAGNVEDHEHRWGGGARPRSVLVVLSLVLLLPSCGNGTPTAETGSPQTLAGTGSPEPEQSGERTNNRTRNAEGGTPGPQASASKSEETFALLAGGPTDEIFPGPPGDKPFELLSTQRCFELLEMTERWGPQGERDPGLEAKLVYSGAAKACLFRWEAASADLNRLKQLQPDFSACPARRAALQWLEQLLDAHRRNPAFSPTFVKSSTQGEQSRCVTPDFDNGPSPEASVSPEASASTDHDPSPEAPEAAGEGDPSPPSAGE